MAQALTDRVDEIRGMFRGAFGGEPEVVVQAPGRVNLIGEHTDYNDGFVFPMAIERSVLVCGRRRDDGRLLMHQPAMASTQGATAESTLEALGGETAQARGETPQARGEAAQARDRERPWANYILGVARELLKSGHSICGAEITVAGDVPIGSGLSSSAAIEVATATFFEALCGLEIAPEEVALLCQRAENQFVGVNCGIMDMFISKLGRAGHALMLDCRSLECRQAPFDDPAVTVVVADTGVRRGLVDSAYNTRRAECESGAHRLGAILGKPVKALRDVSVDELRRAEAELVDPVRQRCRHVIGENQRTLDSVAALERGDWKRFGRLLNESHVSLRDDYEVSCDELNLITDLLRGQEGAVGARMTGAGFGGCAIGVFRGLDEKAVAKACRRIEGRYSERTGLTPSLFATRAAAGAGVVTSDD